MIVLALWRFLMRTPWSTFVAVLGVALGVTSIVSVHLISANIAVRLDALIPSQLAGYSHFLHRDGLHADDYFTLRKTWRRQGSSTITSLAPLIDETTDMDGRAVRVIGVDLLAPDSGLELQRAGTGEVDFSWSGVWIDETLQEHVRQPVNGIVAAPEGTLIGDISVVQDILGWPAGRISYVGARFSEPWSGFRSAGENLLPGFSAGLPAQLPDVGDLAGWDILSLAEQHPASQFGKSVLFNISALGLLALLVAWFLIYQVAVSWLRRLWPVFQRLHVLGVHWRELRFYFVFAMCVLGTVAALLGLAGGQWLAQLLYRLAATNAEAAVFVLDDWVVLKAIGSAVGVCFIGSLRAFNKAQVAGQAGHGSVWIAAGLLVVAVFGVLEPDAGLAGGFLSIAVLCVLAVLLVTPLLLRMRQLSPYIGGPYLARLSVREALWYPQDLGVALAGLTLAVATAIGVGLMVDSFRGDFTRMLERRLSYDVIARGPHQDLTRLQAFAAASDGVARVQGYGGTQLRVDGVPVELVATSVDAAEARRYGLGRDLAAQEVLLSEQGARLLDAVAGDDVLVAGHLLRVAAVFASFGDIQPRLIVDQRNPAASLVKKTDSVSLSSAAAEQLVVALRREFPDLQLQLQTELRRSALATFDQTFSITTVLILIALIVASIGVYVAVTAMRLNRRVSSKLLAGMGVSLFEGVGMDFALGLGIGVIAILLALPLGTVFGWILCSVINPRAFGWTVDLQLSLQAYLMPICWGLLAAACAGVVRIGRQEEGGASVLR